MGATRMEGSKLAEVEDLGVYDDPLYVCETRQAPLQAYALCDAPGLPRCCAGRLAPGYMVAGSTWQKLWGTRIRTVTVARCVTLRADHRHGHLALSDLLLLSVPQSLLQALYNTMLR